jgi:aldehyde dehydrogenase (NAD+)
MMTDLELSAIFNRQWENRHVIAATDSHVRIAKLKKLREYLLARVDQACEATKQDFGKPAAETIIGELLVLINEITHTIKHLHQWMKPERQSTPLTMIGTSAYIQYEPKGCTLIIAPWNYPIALALKPLVSAIAAGCTAIVKPSEMTPYSADFVSTTIQSLFNDNEVAVIQGDADTASALLKLPFNHIFFTGSPAVGKIVMKAAAEHLASVTLELGGKSPSIVDATADIKASAERIAWAKFFNNGQTCIAPDYVLVDQSVEQQLVSELKKAILKMYVVDAQTIEESASYGRIVNTKHFERLQAHLQNAKELGAVVATGDDCNSKSRYFAPTLLTHVTREMSVMNEEIFGPILPVMTFQSMEQAINIVNDGEKPLALYIHSKNNATIEKILKNTSSGNALVNEMLTQFGHTEIPFGGVNNSGIGKSNGFYGFKEFSNAKGVMKRRFGTMKFLYPPYSARLEEWLKKGLRWV